MAPEAPKPGFKPALVVVDLQEDFCPPLGSLAIESGRDVAQVINSLLSLPFALKVATKDWHPQNHVSFASNHAAPNNVPFVSEIAITNPKDPTQVETSRLWPDHCVQGTAGAQLISELDTSRLDSIVEKGQDQRVEMYSAFADPFQTHVSESGLETLLKHADITDVYCVGLAMDYCVKFTALDSSKAGFKTYVISEGTKAVNPADWDEVVRILSSGGVKMVTLDSKEIQCVKEMVT